MNPYDPILKYCVFAMKSFHLVVSACILLGLISSANAQQNERKEPLVQQVRTAIDKGVGYLRQKQRNDGSWEIDQITIAMSGGQSCIAMLGLLNAGVPTNDPMMRRGLEYIRGLTPNTTYVRALQTMVLSEAGSPLDRAKIKKNVDWLINARVIVNEKLMGWGYSRGGVFSGKTKGISTDNSNTQYALLGLLAGRNAGVDIPEAVWQSIREYYIDSQLDDGGWPYSPQDFVGNPHGRGATLTMTTAGIASLLIAGLELNEGREKILASGERINCGVYKENETTAKALIWLRKNFSLQMGSGGRANSGRTFYNMYGIERAGRLSGLRFFGRHDWYREGCQFLVKIQRDDGAWELPGTYDRWSMVSTGFALLFLSKGRTPVLISRVVHGDWPRNDADTDWNNDRNSLKNLTQYASKQLFKDVPLAWQIFDMMRAVEAENNQLTDQALSSITSEMLQSPIFFLNGHRSPRLRLRDVEKELLKRYIENGGFIIAEACCGKNEFDKGFRELLKEIWPDNELVDLPADHAIWRAYFPVPPGSFKLKGMQMGCKTVLIYSPEDLSCHWESNNFKTGEGQLAFRLGANLVAYATGMEPPRPRLTEVEVASTKDDPRLVPRGFVKIAQLRHSGDWQPAPRAMRNLLEHVHKYANVDVALKTEAMPVYHQDLIDFKFLYMHGRGNFTYPEKDLKQLEFNLKTGGLLFADACCGNEAFDESFRKLMKTLFPKQKLEPVPTDDVLYSKELSGLSLNAETIRCRLKRGEPFRATPPLLEGIKIDDRWVVLYSRYDIGCALERHQSSDCLGYDYESAVRIGTAALLYQLRP